MSKAGISGFSKIGGSTKKKNGDQDGFEKYCKRQTSTGRSGRGAGYFPGAVWASEDEELKS